MPPLLLPRPDETYAGRRVLVTGHTGFKGAWLSIWLHRLGARVSGLAVDVPTTPSLYAAAKVASLLADDVRADIRDPDAVRRYIEAVRPEIVFHLAAESLVRRSYQRPLATFETNLMGTLHLLEALRARNDSCAVLLVTSDKCYENREQDAGYRESDPLGGHDPYSASKGCVEVAAASYRRSFCMPAADRPPALRIATARAGNVIGGGDWAADRILPDLVRALGAGETAGIRHPGAVRPWQHVLDPLWGYLLLGAGLLSATPGPYCTAWNFGPPAGSEWTVGALADCVCRCWGGAAAWTALPQAEAPHEAKLLRLCADKAAAELGWRPRWDAGEAVRHAVRWYKAHAQQHPVLDVCHDDIQDYENACA